MPLTVIDHPLAHHIMTHLRERTTDPQSFRNLTHRISLLLALEATRDLATKEAMVETPLERHTGLILGKGLVVIPVLRAGLGMVQPIVDMFPDVSIGYIGLERDHVTAIAHSYYCKLPPLEDKRVLVVDPMLATGGTAVQALELIFLRNAKDVSLLSIVAAPEGVAHVHQKFPKLRIFAAALDRELNAHKYILPGLGDFGDRLYGT